MVLNNWDSSRLIDLHLSELVRMISGTKRQELYPILLMEQFCHHQRKVVSQSMISAVQRLLASGSVRFHS